MLDADLGGESDPLSPKAREWANLFGVYSIEVSQYLLALGNAPAYSSAFSEPMETERVRFPATKDEKLFQEAIEIGVTLLNAWTLCVLEIGVWEEKAPGAPIGTASFTGNSVEFENGSRLNDLPSGLDELVISSFPVFVRYLEDRKHLPLDAELARDIRVVAGAIASILCVQDKCDDVLKRIIAAPMMSF